MHCERRRNHVDLVNAACQTDPVIFGEVKPAAGGEEEETERKEDASLPKEPSLKSVLGGKKEKPMSVDNAMLLVPSIYEQYMTMLENPGPDTEGKHLNLVTFTKNALIRKYGLKNVAMKQFRAFAACLQSKKALKLSRLRTFASLYGLPTAHGAEGKAYDVSYVDFFFKQLLCNVFLGAKHCNAILAAKGRSDIDKDKFIEKRMEEIFPNFLRKDGFKYMVLERSIEDSTSRVVKGIDMVDADDLIEKLVPHWMQETLLRKMTWQTMRCIRNFQQKCLHAMRKRREMETDKSEMERLYSE